MKFTRNLMTGLFGLAMLAAPITAAAQGHDNAKSNSHQEQAQSHESHASAPSHGAAPASHNEGRAEHSARIETRSAAPSNMNRNEGREERSARVETRNAAPAVATRNETRDNARSYNSAPAVTEHRDVRVDRGHDNGDRDVNRGGRDYRNYGHDYDHDDYGHDREYASSGWVMPYGYSGGACGWAQHLRNVIRRDEYTGHPAAASDLMGQMHRAERACGGVPYGYNTYRYGY